MKTLNITMKCEICNRKLTLVDQSIFCACGKNMLCVIHKTPPTQHSCCFDYRKQQQTFIEINNQQIIPEKISKL